MQTIVEKKYRASLFLRYLVFFKEHRYYIISLFFLIFGMFIGALSVEWLTSDYSGFINSWFKSFVGFRNEAGFIKLFFNNFLTGFLVIFLMVVSSFGLGGIIVSPLVIFIRGFATCVLSGILYRNYSLQGIAFSNLILLPSCLLTDFLYLYFCEKAIQLSCEFLNILRDVSAKGIVIKPQCVKVLKGFALCAALMAVASAVEAIFSSCFIKYFSF